MVRFVLAFILGLCMWFASYYLGQRLLKKGAKSDAELRKRLATVEAEAKRLRQLVAQRPHAAALREEGTPLASLELGLENFNRTMSTMSNLFAQQPTAEVVERLRRNLRATGVDIRWSVGVTHSGPNGEQQTTLHELFGPPEGEQLWVTRPTEEELRALQELFREEQQAPKIETPTAPPVPQKKPRSWYERLRDKDSTCPTTTSAPTATPPKKTR